MFSAGTLYACNVCGRSDTFSRVCDICEACLRAAYVCPPSYFSTAFVRTVLMFEGDDRRAFAEAFYNMLCEEESDAVFPI